MNAECRMQNLERLLAGVLNSKFCILRSAFRFGAKGGTRTHTALGHGILSPARLPIPPLSPNSGLRTGSRGLSPTLSPQSPTLSPESWCPHQDSNLEPTD